MAADDEDDARFLAQAVALSRSHMETGHGGPFGSVIVRDGAVIAEGWNAVTSADDPTAQAEVTAIRRACAAVDDASLSGALLCSSCEPCPMCLSAITWARLDRLVCADTRDQAAAIGFDDAFHYEEVPEAPRERRMPTRHLAMPGAEATFHAWSDRADKVSR